MLPAHIKAAGDAPGLLCTDYIMGALYNRDYIIHNMPGASPLAYCVQIITRACRGSLMLARVPGPNFPGAGGADGGAAGGGARGQGCGEGPAPSLHPPTPPLTPSFLPPSHLAVFSSPHPSPALRCLADCLTGVRSQAYLPSRACAYPPALPLSCPLARSHAAVGLCG